MDGLDMEQRLASGALAAKRPPRRLSPAAAHQPVTGDAETVPIRPGTMIGDYRVDRRLDEGGMGTVYAAVHPVIHKRVAIKVLHPHVARQEEAVARFVQEARAVTAIGHPGIVDIFGFGRFVDGRHYIIMEYLEGQQLLAFLNEVGTISSLEMLAVTAQLAESLAAAHGKGVVHRDMKPENVFLSITAAQYGKVRWPPRAKILDFGLAKLLEAERNDDKPNTRAGITVGTPYYMSPEQCRGKAVDPRCDVYALGVMMYEMITGRVPFYAPDAVDVLYMHLTQPPEPPSRHRTVPPDVEALVLKCMAKQADDRPQSMHALLQEIQAIQRKLSPDAGSGSRPPEELKLEASAFFGDLGELGPGGAAAAVYEGAGGDGDAPRSAGGGTAAYERDSNRVTSPMDAAQGQADPMVGRELAAPWPVPQDSRAQDSCVADRADDHSPLRPVRDGAGGEEPIPMSPHVSERPRSAAPVPALPEGLSPLPSEAVAPAKLSAAPPDLATDPAPATAIAPPATAMDPAPATATAPPAPAMDPAPATATAPPAAVPPETAIQSATAPAATHAAKGSAGRAPVAGIQGAAGGSLGTLDRSDTTLDLVRYPQPPSAASPGGRVLWIVVVIQGIVILGLLWVVLSKG